MAHSESPDLALLYVEESGIPLEKNTHGITIGEAVYTIGAPLGIYPTMTNGNVTKCSYSEGNVDFILTNIGTISGNSGGAVVNSYGEVIGVVMGGMSDGLNSIDLIINLDNLNQLNRSNPENILTREEYFAELNKPDEEKYEIVELENARPGTLVRLGHYEQDNDLKNGDEDILWLVLERNGNELKLVSLYCLDAMPYSLEDGAVTWETSYVRQWLNETFYNRAFTEQEKSKILLTDVNNDDNPVYGTDGGNDTQDYIYLLSHKEVMQYWNIPECVEGQYSQLATQATNYCMTKPVWLEVDGSSCCWWWLRSPGSSNLNAAEVGTTGYLSFGGVCATVVDDLPRAVRPVINISLDN